MKICTRCKEERDELEFRRNSRTKDGLSYHCVYCARKESKERHQHKKHKVRVPTNKTHKTCRTCKRTLQLMAFYKNCSTADGYDSQCKVCNNVSSKKSKDKIYEFNDPSKIDWNGTKVCSTCSNKKQKTDFVINRTHKDGLSSQCIQCENEYKQSYNGRLSQMLSRAKVRAKKKQVDCDISVDILDEIMPEDMVCPVLGIPLEWNNAYMSESSPSIDRIIPELGYVKDNIQIISVRANRIKNDSTKEELERVLKWLNDVT